MKHFMERLAYLCPLVSLPLPAGTSLCSLNNKYWNSLNHCSTVIHLLSWIVGSLVAAVSCRSEGIFFLIKEQSNLPSIPFLSKSIVIFQLHQDIKAAYLFSLLFIITGKSSSFWGGFVMLFLWVFVLSRTIW